MPAISAPCTEPKPPERDRHVGEQHENRADARKHIVEIRQQRAGDADARAANAPRERIHPIDVDAQP